MRNSFWVVAFILLCSSFGVSFAQMDAVVLLNGTVLDEVSRLPVEISISAVDATGKKNQTRSNKLDGSYTLVLKPGMDYTFTFDSPNFFKEKIKFVTPKSTKYSNLSKDWLVKPLTKGMQFALSFSPFEYKKSKLRVGADEFLGEMVNTLKENPNVKFEIQCFPDIEQDKSNNIKLTQERSSNLKEFFSKNGISPDRMVVKSSSEIDPLNPPPLKQLAKGKRYVGNTYIIVQQI